MAAIAFATSLPLALAEAALGTFQWPTPFGWLVLALVTLFPSFLAQISFIQGVSLIGPSRAGVFVNLVPVFASILALLVLEEPFEPFHAMALGLVLGGIWLSERGKQA
jgi:drug/metabolite transporter (DMT)-like permease